jgi:hypothetical protein
LGLAELFGVYGTVDIGKQDGTRHDRMNMCREIFEFYGLPDFCTMIDKFHSLWDDLSDIPQNAGPVVGVFTVFMSMSIVKEFP